MDLKNEGKKPLRPLHWWLVLSVGLLLSALTLWSWQKWDAVWIERSESFFPPEWQNEEIESLAWQYPIYRSNDTYQWVHVADALAAKNRTPLYHRFDEGTAEGRPNRWHSGLAHLLSIGGSLVANTQDWPAQRGIHSLAHWLGAAIHILAILLGAFSISLLAGRRAALLFAGLFFFNAAIAWDFAFSRLDHEAVLQFFFLFHLLGLVGLSEQKGKHRTRWALIAGVSAGFCWWISATVVSALSIPITLGLALECYRQRNVSGSEMAKAITTWGGSAAVAICLLGFFDGRIQLSPSIATIHPIFIFVQIGAALFCLAMLQQPGIKQGLSLGVGLLCGLSPIAWLLTYKSEAHPWLDPMMRRLHDYIVEFQSPFSNGLWPQAESLQAVAAALLAIFALNRSKKALLVCLVACLVALALFQTRWLGLLAATSTVVLCLNLRRESISMLTYLAYGLLLLSLGTWIHKWSQIEETPGQIFVTDLMLQVGARDINLNLQKLSEGGTIRVAMPYAFAATSAMFPEIHPIGTFYWENKRGIEASSNLFSGIAPSTKIDFIVVQGGRQGEPFAKLTTWVARGDEAPSTVKSSTAWKLSTLQDIEGWIEKPYFGTFGTNQFSVRIFEIDHSKDTSLKN